jgi:nitrite reductase (NO-forming)
MVPDHPHLGLGSLTILGIVLGVIAAIVGFGALYGVANQDETVVAAPAVATDGFSSVIPDIVPKSQLTVASEVNTAYAPNVPPPSGRTAPAIVDVRFEVVEGVVAIDPATGVEFETWGYKIEGDADAVTGTPGPIVRARVGDVLTFTLTNPAGNAHSHNIDFHAVTGQGGGAADTLVAPGETKTIEARLLYPGIFMYHCAAEDVPAHIAHGMYGGILVDPVEPLPAADHEFYVVQSEFYTTGTEPGLVELDRAALTDEHPTMVVFNGAKGALAGDNALEIAVGDRARFYFVNAGLNLDSNFHPIGSHWDAVWPEGATLSVPLRGSQTTLVPAGGGVVVDLLGVVPSNIILVDHALTRTFDKGALGIVTVVGDANPEIFEAANEPPAAAEPIPEGDFTVDMPEGAFGLQDLDHPSEFAEVENPVDYSVNVLRVPVGSTVVWTNSDSAVHTVTSVDGVFDSGNMNPGTGFAFTFDEPGEYEYFCVPHPWMRAKVIVEG